MADGSDAAAPAVVPLPPATPGRGRRAWGGRGAGRRHSLPPAVLSAGAEEAEPLVDLHSFDAAAPELFYLPDASCCQLADCYALVEGERLPLHSAVLALQSSVLRDLFVQFRQDAAGAAASQGPVELSSTFADCSLCQAACFLRLVYRPDHASGAALAALHRAEAGLLPALVRLAHRLDAAPLLGKLEACLQGAAASAAAPALLASLQLAEVYHLEALRGTCLQLLARRLAAAGPYWHEQLSAEQLAGCAPDSLARLVGEMAGAVHAGGFEPPRVLNIGRGAGGRAGGFTFVISRFGQQTARVASPWVEVGGLQWRLKVWPHGDAASGGTHLSAYLEVNAVELLAKRLPAARVCYEFCFLDQIGEGVHYSVDCGTDTFTSATANWGKTQMVPLEVLRDPRRHLLDGDRLAIRVAMRVVPPSAVAAAAAAATAAGAAAAGGAPGAGIPVAVAVALVAADEDAEDDGGEAVAGL